MADFLALCRLRSECTRRAGAKNPEKSLPLLKRERANVAKMEAQYAHCEQCLLGRFS